jgi:hypothetical protein
MAWQRGQDHDGLLEGTIAAVEDFNPADANAVATAADDAKAHAENRRERMPSSAAAFDRRAAALLEVRDKILDRLPEKWHAHRELVYRDYKPK